MYTPEFKNILTSTLDGLRAEGLYKEERFIVSPILCSASSLSVMFFILSIYPCS